jgi:DNA-binding SARP family transcriptional activator/ABC-type transport system substrate-binding protein
MTEAMHGLSFRLLGPLQVIRSGQQVPLGGRQQKAILALLLVDRDTVVSVDRLIDAVWGARAPQGAVATIHSYISHLREIVEPDRVRGRAGQVLLTERGGYRLRVEDLALDSKVFEGQVRAGRALLADDRPGEATSELTGALALWRGPALADLVDFEFARLAAARLEELRLVAIEERIDADLALGRHRDLAAELDRLIGEHPLRERLHGQRMVARYRSGRQAEALAGYQELRVLLADEVGIDPSFDVQRLHKAILSQDRDLDWHPAAAVTVREAQRSAEATAPSVVEPSVQGVLTGGASRRSWRRRRVALVAALSVAAVAATVTVVAVRSETTTLEAQANSVGRIDKHGRLGSVVPVGQGPSGVAYGAGSLWVTNTGDGTVSRVNPASSQVTQTTDVGAAPSAVTVTGEDVWVANGGAGTVSRVNALSGTQTERIPVGNQPTAVAAGRHGVWVANGGDDTIQRIDPVTGKPGHAILVGGYPDGIAVSESTVWVANGQDGTVSRVDVATGMVDSPIRVGAGPMGLALTGDSLWVANELDLTVSRIELRTARVVDTVSVGDGPNSVVAGPDGVWVSNEFDGTVTRIDPATDKGRTILSGSSPRGMAMIGSSPWVAFAGRADTAHRGGTLHVESGGDVPGEKDIDLQDSYDQPTLAMLYDGLVAQRRIGGTAGLTLVPDLATRLPEPTHGGKVYTFTLRRGVHYSNGMEVKPDDIRRGLLRALHGSGTDYYTGIVGAKECVAAPATCDLSSGLFIDEAKRRIVLTLTEPDPEFLYKLSLFVYAAPPGVPLGKATTPIPSTGPYMISNYKPGVEELTLVRNPHFKLWSFAARPDGYPDVIQWKQVKDAAQQSSDLLSGRADVMDFLLSGVPPGLIDTISRQHPTRLHSDFGLAQIYVWMDTRAAPFNDRRVRQAVNYAIDRAKVPSMFGGDAAAEATCQFLPPDFPGYVPYCRYTQDPRVDGTYRGPDMAAAHRLVSASRTTGMSISVPIGSGLNDYIAELLRHLRYRVSRTPDDGKAPIGGGYWGADFAAPSNFWAVNLACGAMFNRGGYCNHSLDARAESARALEATDPAAARQLWSELAHRITVDAPWVFLVSVRKTAVVSSRVGNYQANPVVGPLLDQMWVR